MKNLKLTATAAALVSALILSLGIAHADNLGRLNGYAKVPGSNKTALPVSNAIVVDKSSKSTSHGRLSGYAENSYDAASQLETIPVLAGMHDIKPVKESIGYGRLDAYSDHQSDESATYFQILDSTNTAVWY